jgi:hypothetical protein
MPRDLLNPSPLASFIVANCAALSSAAALLGGEDAERRAKALIDEFTLAPPLSRRLDRALDALEDLLSLRHVDDLDRLEAERFALLDPDDPVVEELCLLLEGLRTARAAEERAQ